MRTIVTRWRTRRKRDCFFLGLYLNESISRVNVCCSIVAFTLAYGTVGLPMMVKSLPPTSKTVPKTICSPASRRESLLHCTRSPTVTLCWCRILDLKTANEFLPSTFGKLLVVGISGIGDLCGIWRCQMNEHV